MSRKRLPYLLLLLLIAALYATLSAVTPLYLDDWTFLGNWRDDAGNDSFTFGGLWRYYEFIRGYDNGRIANLLSPIFSIYTPFKQLFPLLTGLALAYTVAMVVRFSRGKAPAVPVLAVVWMLMILFLPWFDTLFVADYSLNYIWGGAITLGLLQCMLRLRRDHYPNWLFPVAIILAIVAGGWHEGFALPTLCGLIVLVFIKKGSSGVRYLTVLAVYAVSTFAFMLSPGMLGRIGAAAASDFNFPYIRSYLIGIVALAFYLYCSLFLKGRSEIRDIWCDNRYKVLTVIALSAYVLGFVSTRTPRSFYYADLLAIIFVVKLIFAICRGRIVRHKGVVIAFAAVLVLGCTAQSVAAIFWQTRYTSDWEAIVGQLEAGSNGSVYYDFPTPSRAPLYTLGMPVSNAWRNPYHYRALQSYYLTPVLGVVPTELKNADYDNGAPVNPGSKLRRCGEYLVSPFEKLDSATEIIIPVNVGRHLVIPFITLQGDTLLYYQR